MCVYGIYTYIMIFKFYIKIEIIKISSKHGVGKCTE